MLKEDGEKLLQEIADWIHMRYHLLKRQGVNNIHDVLLGILKTLFEVKCPARNIPKPIIWTSYPIPQPDLVVQRLSDEFEEYFGCEKIWVELDVESDTSDDKIEQLKGMLNRKWRILIITKDGDYEIHEPWL